MSEPPPHGLQLTEVGGREICPLCRDDFEPESKVWSCRDCQTRYHLDCQLELGGCSTLGCARGGGGAEPTLEGGQAPLQRVRPEFGHCSACGAMAHREDLEDCPACGAWRHRACASQIGCGNAECDHRPKPAASPHMLQSRRWALKLFVLGGATGLAALFSALFEDGQRTMIVAGACSLVCLLAGSVLQRRSLDR